MTHLSKRLKLIASLVPKGARVCDVGTDHGYLSIELIKNGTAQSVIATDINQKPLANAAKNISLANVGRIELRLCDGLSGVSPQEADTVIIAGMGGEVISGILERGKQLTARKAVSLILQPTTSPEVLRCFLYKNGYEIVSEHPLKDNNKLYSVMLCRYIEVSESFPAGFSFIGKISPQTEDGLLYIKKQYNRCFKCMKALEHIHEKKSELLKLKGVCDYINSILKEQNNGV